MAVYPIPKKKWAEDRSWLLMGVAIRFRAIMEKEDDSYANPDLHRPLPPEPAPVPHPQGVDVVSLALRTEAELSHELSGWVDIYAQEFSNFPIPICNYRGNTTQLITAYLRLVVLTVGFQHAVKSGLSKDSEILQKSIKAAREVIQIMAERLFPTGHLRFAMGAHFLYVSFAAAFLINLLRPTLLHLLDGKTQSEIIQDVQDLIKILGSEDVAIDTRHTPALYCRFLSSLLAKHHSVLPQVSFESPVSDPYSTPYPRDGQTSDTSFTYSWPDITYGVDQHDQQHNGISIGGSYQAGEVDMDLSLSHFVRTVTQGYPPLPDPSPYVDMSYVQESRWDVRGSYATMPFADLWRT
ncbi:hypothetical protein C0992_001853 [Termitomyces sp. T32_za158]|nr:hypothetical protein C0992_001853 [Termitomyces sp. T32_za158]